MHVCVSDNDFESASTIFLLDIGTGLMFLCLFVCLFLVLFVCLYFFFWLLLPIFSFFYYYICIIFLFNFLHKVNYFTDDNWFPNNISHI